MSSTERRLPCFSSAGIQSVWEFLEFEGRKWLEEEVGAEKRGRRERGIEIRLFNSSPLFLSLPLSLPSSPRSSSCRALSVRVARNFMPARVYRRERLNWPCGRCKKGRERLKRCFAFRSSSKMKRAHKWPAKKTENGKEREKLKLYSSSSSPSISKRAAPSASPPVLPRSIIAPVDKRRENSSSECCAPLNFETSADRRRRRSLQIQSPFLSHPL